MSKLILYLLEASVVLAILYSLYAFLLSKETFFSLNRFFLLAILVFSFLFPVVSFDFSVPGTAIINEPIENLSSMRMSYYDALELWSQEGMSNPASGSIESESALKQNNQTRATILMVLLVIYTIGLVAMAFRLIWTYTWIYRTKKRYPKERIDGMIVVKVPYQMAPFSFMNAVFVHEDMLGSDQFDQILAHEKTHILQRHSIDLIIVQLLAAILWFNPVVWLLIKSLKTTHEYIADKTIIKQGYSLVEYQSLLLRQLISNNSFGLVHNFNLTFIKKRITMMKIQESGRAGKIKVAIVLSTVAVLSLIIVQCNSRVLDDQLQPNLVAGNLTQQSNQDADLFMSSLPELPQTDFKFDGALDETIEIIIQEDEINIDGQVYELDQVASVIEKSGLTPSGVVVLKVDKNQRMSVVRDVQFELRKANRRKVVYMARTAEGEKAEMPFLLPPVPGDNNGVQMPTIDEQYAAANNIALLKIDLGNQEGLSNQRRVYDFVKEQVSQGNSNYVVSATHQADDSYGDYLLNLNYIQEGFNQLYQERSQKMFGKNFYDLDRMIEEEKQQYNTVRKGVPRAISVAEK